MNRKSKLLSIILAAVFCLSAITLTVNAADLDGDGIDDDQSGVVVTDPAPVVTEAPYVEPTYAPVATEPAYVDPGYDDNSGSNSNSNSSSNNYDDNNNYDSNSNNDSNYNYSDNNDNSDNNSSDQSSYIGGGQSTYVVPDSTAPSASLYDSDGNIDDSVLSNNDWKDIESNLKNANNSGSDGDDFNFIKKNEDKNDNGDWVLICGIVCLLLSGCGIAYLIVSAVLRRKKYSKAIPSGRKFATAGAGSSYSHDDSRSSGEYSDGYRQSSHANKKPQKRKNRFDTAEVSLPPSAKRGGHYKDNNRRYR